jgi:hypothetical protein
LKIRAQINARAASDAQSGLDNAAVKLPWPEMFHNKNPFSYLFWLYPSRDDALYQYYCMFSPQKSSGAGDPRINEKFFTNLTG